MYYVVVRRVVETYMYDMRISTYTIQFSTQIVHLEEFFICAATDKKHAGKPAVYLTVSSIELRNAINW